MFSLQPLILHGRMAARVLLAQLAFEVTQRSPRPFPCPFPSYNHVITGSGLNGSCVDGIDGIDQADQARGVHEQQQQQQQRRWNNIVQLGFVAANLVSDDVSTITVGLFHDRADIMSSYGRTVSSLPLNDESDDTNLTIDYEAMHTSAASTSVPYLLCSNSPVHGSVALATRVLEIFGVTVKESPTDLLRLYMASSTIPDQGPLMFPLLRLSFFLLGNLHLFTEPALVNLHRLDSHVAYLLSDAWQEYSGDRTTGSDDMCIVVLAHVHAALLRLKAQATALGISVSSERISEARSSCATGASLECAGSITIALKVGEVLLGLLQRLIGRRLHLLTRTLGESLSSDLQNAVRRSATCHEDEHMRKSQQPWERLVKSLSWMEGSDALFVSVANTPRPAQGVTALLDACMASLKVSDSK